MRNNFPVMPHMEEAVSLGVIAQFHWPKLPWQCLLHYWFHALQFINTVRCRYNAVNYLPDPHKTQLIACPWWHVLDVGCKFEVWFTFYRCHLIAVCLIMVNWTVLWRHCNLIFLYDTESTLEVQTLCSRWHRCVTNVTPMIHEWNCIGNYFFLI